MKNPALWEKLEAFTFDAGTGTEPFSVKLAAAEAWDATFAARVIEEYRRFLYLAQVADHEVTPSVAVDRAWHTHLTFTRSYWEELCEGVLGGPFHHDPCKGSEDMPRYNAQYERTLALYFSEFGHVPPHDIWPRSGTETTPEGGDALQKWFATKGIVIGLCAGLPVLVIMMIFGVNVFTVLALVVCGALIFAGILAFPGTSRHDKQAAGGGTFVGGCSGGSKKSGGGASDGGSDGGSAGCGGGGCGGGGG
ncbi:MAG: hypothetical protein ABJF50_06415 [Paracoccaceae bacterium]